MEICFVPDNDYGNSCPAAELAQKHRGEIVNLQGQVLGHHEGIEFYTIGQRKGLGLSSPKPLYVIELDASTTAWWWGTTRRWTAMNSPWSDATGFRSISRRRKCKSRPKSVTTIPDAGHRPGAGRRRSEGDAAHAAAGHHSGTGLRFLRRRPGGGRGLDHLTQDVMQEANTKPACLKAVFRLTYPA